MVFLCFSLVLLSFLYAFLCFAMFGNDAWSYGGSPTALNLMFFYVFFDLFYNILQNFIGQCPVAILWPVSGSCRVTIFPQLFYNFVTALAMFCYVLRDLMAVAWLHLNFQLFSPRSDLGVPSYAKKPGFLALDRRELGPGVRGVPKKPSKNIAKHSKNIPKT